VLSKIVSKVVMDKRVLGGHWEEVFFFVLTVLGLVGSNIGKDIKTDNWGGGDWSTGDNVRGAVGNIEEGVILWVVKDRPGKFGGWGTGDKRSGCWGSIRVKLRAWEVPSVVVELEDFKDGSGSVSDVLLINIIKGRPGGDRDVGEGGGGNDGRLGSSEGHFTYTVSST